MGSEEPSFVLLAKGGGGGGGVYGNMNRLLQCEGNTLFIVCAV